MVEMAGWNSPVSQREYTCILYLNPSDWCGDNDGGRLRIFSGCDDDDDDGSTAMHIEDVVPIGGTIVLFDSRTILHEVLPASRKRFAMTAWLLNEGAVLAD